MNSKIIGISRHRIGVEGPGVTTLVAFHDLPFLYITGAMQSHGNCKSYTLWESF